MCFVSNQDLIISTELQNYGVHLSSGKLFGELVVQEEEMHEDIVNYLTSKPKEKIKYTEIKLTYLSSFSFIKCICFVCMCM